MKINKNISMTKVYKILESYCSDLSNSLENRTTIYRFLSKLSDTEDFELRVNREFSAYKLKNKKDAIEDAITNRKEIQLPCEFLLHPIKTTNWQLYWNDELFLDSLDPKIAKRIAYDINVAFAIKVSQVNK